MTNAAMLDCCEQGAQSRTPTVVTAGSPEERAGVARRMGEVLNVELSAAERRAAEDIVRALCNDLVDAVRKALAVAVASSPHLPGQVARRLALDIEEISIPVLEACNILTDDVLLQVIGKGTARQLEATARRPVVSEAVSEALVERGHVPSVSILAANRGAQLSAETWIKVIERHGGEAIVVQAAGSRGGIPEAVACKLATMAKAHVRTFVVRYLNVPSSIMPALDNLQVEVWDGRRVVPVVPAGTQPGAHAKMLKQQGKLSHGVLFQGLCAGEIGFVVAALSQLTGLSFPDVQRRLFATSPFEREGLLERAGIDASMAAVFQRILDMGAISDIGEFQTVALKTLSAAAGRDVASSAPAQA